MKVAYVGNFEPAHSTENHVRRALESLDVEVVPLQESGREWADLKADTTGADFMLWTRTAGFDPPDMTAQQYAVDSLGIPTVGYHLDRWWGLNREPDVHRSPFFTLDLVCTADGGHDKEWAKIGVNHKWFPPAVLAEEAVLGEHRDFYRADIGFVGNLLRYGHPEWGPYRRKLARYLTLKYRRQFRVFPGDNQPAIRGKALQDLYASVKIVVGDSCLAGGIEKYWSDRIPETCGRGAFLIHPEVVGLESEYPDLVTYPLGDFEALGHLIDHYLVEDETRRELAKMNRAHVLDGQTYQHRMIRLLQEIEEL